MKISNLKKYKGVVAFYMLIIASVFLISARINELNKVEITTERVVAINK